MEVDPVSVIGVGLVIIGLLTEHFYYQAALRERVATLETSIKAMEGMSEDMREVKTKVDLFWGALETQIPGLLLKGNPISPDTQLFEHLQKFMAHQITQSEIVCLVNELDKEAKVDEHTPGEKLAIILMSAMVKAKIQADGAGLWTYTLSSI